jgi:hypothetical protein
MKLLLTINARNKDAHQETRNWVVDDSMTLCDVVAAAANQAMITHPIVGVRILDSREASAAEIKHTLELTLIRYNKFIRK